jgi:transposase
MEPKHPSSKRYPPELKERAVRLVQEARQRDPGDKTAIPRTARQLGIGAESLRLWVRQAEIDAGRQTGVTSEEAAEIRRLRRENAELRRANEILQAAASFFGAELDRRQRR